MNRSKALELLGLKGNPSDEDLKKAYRKKAMKHHPDRDGGDESKFKEIKEAFEFLESNQSDSTDTKSPYWQSESDAIRKYWKDQADAWDKQQPRCFAVDVEVSLSDAFKGCTRKVDLSSMGLPPEKVIIQPGLKPGVRLKTVNGLNGESLVTVDIFLKIDIGESTVIWPTELWLLGGAIEGSGNITERLNVNWLTIMTGGFITVKTLDGTEGTVRIPAGIETGRRLKAAGKGYWSDGKCSRRGDLFLEIAPVIPKSADLTNYEILEFMNIVKDRHLQEENETGYPL